MKKVGHYMISIILAQIYRPSYIKKKKKNLPNQLKDFKGELNKKQILGVILRACFYKQKLATGYKKYPSLRTF